MTLLIQHEKPELCRWAAKSLAIVGGSVETSVIIWGGLLIDSTVVSTAGYRAFVPFVLITPNHELWINNRIVWHMHRLWIGN